MKKIESMEEKINFLNWYLGFKITDLAECKSLSIKETEELIEKRFSEVENLENELEAYNDTYAFRKESVMLEHDYPDLNGYSYDRTIVEYKGKKYKIKGQIGTVTKYDWPEICGI